MSTPVDPIERKLEREVVETSIASCKTMAGSPEALAWHSAVKDLIAHRTAHTPKPPDCRPPAEHEGERWHWLEHTSSFEPWAWCGHGDTGWYRGDLDAPLISPMDMAKAGWFYCSVAPPVARPSPEIEFDEALERVAAVDEFNRQHNSAAVFSAGRVQFVEGWIARARSRTFRPSPPGEQVDPTDEAIMEFWRAQPGWFDSRIQGVQVIRTALNRFRSPARTVSDETLKELFTQASTFGCIPKLWGERVRALVAGNP